MVFGDVYHTKTALRNFVEKQIQPGDLVAVYRTDYGNSALNMFYSDKRELLARIDAIPAAKYSIPFSIANEKIFTADINDNLLSALSFSINTLKSLRDGKFST